MIVLLFYFANLSASSYSFHSSTGEQDRQDSVLVSYDELRIANAKMIELEYEKSINKNLINIISNDSIAISVLRTRIDSMDNDYKRNIKQVKSVRNILGVVSGLEFVLIILLIL